MTAATKLRPPLPRFAEALQRYRDEAVPFQPRALDVARPPPVIRVAATLLTCATAVAILNHAQAPAEPDSTYRYLNVHNPRCPLLFDPTLAIWSCAAGLESHPAWGFNWAGVHLLCAHLGARLPREHEWISFASNNDPSRIYPWGNAEPDPQRANFAEHIGGTSAVRRFAPNELGLYDLAGNLGEWCEDVFDTASVDPDAPARAFERVVKGGAWSKDARHLKVASRRGKWERLGTTTIGVRPVWDDTP